MPHTSSRHRKPPPHQSKLTTSSSSDGWSHVVRKGGSASTTNTRLPSCSNGTSYSNAELVELLTPAQLIHFHRQRRRETHGEIADVPSEVEEKDFGPKPQPPRCSEEELRKRFDRVMAEWRNCGMEERVRRVLESAEMLERDTQAEVGKNGTEFDGESEDNSEDNTQAADEMASKVDKLSMQDKPLEVTKMICLGLGSPSADASGWRHIVIWQLVAFLAIAEILQPSPRSTATATHPPSLKLYAQDPVFNILDISFLTSLHIEVVPSPSAFALIDNNTAIYAPHYPIACWSTEMRQGQAKCIIGNDVAAALASGRILGEKDLLTLFAENEAIVEKIVPSMDQDEEKEDRLSAAEIPDLHAKTELEIFETKHDRMRWPEPGAGVAEGAFNDTVVYWLHRVD